MRLITILDEFEDELRLWIFEAANLWKHRSKIFRVRTQGGTAKMPWLRIWQFISRWKSWKMLDVSGRFQKKRTNQDLRSDPSWYFSPSRVATLRSSYGKCSYCTRRARHFSCKFPYKMVLVKCPCAFRLRKLAKKRCPRRCPWPFFV